MIETALPNGVKATIISLGFALVAFGCSPQPIEDQPEASTSRPNIVLVFADDLGYGDPQCYNPASLVPTPNIDKLARQGLKFTDAHSASSVCSPSRYAILTGRYAWRDRLNSSVVWQWDPPLLEEERITLPEMLQTLGYETACIGKWHLGWAWHDAEGNPVVPAAGMPDYPQRLTNAQRKEIAEQVDFTQSMTGGPLSHGFDNYFGDDVPNFPPYTWFEQDGLVTLPTEEKPKEWSGRPGVMAAGWRMDAVMPGLTERAVQSIHQWGSDDSAEPFFLYMPLTAPHTPIVPAKEFQGASAAGDYGDYVHQVDATLGAVMQALEESGLRDNTVIIFSSDNGSPARTGTTHPAGSVLKRFGHSANGELRGLKADIWEAGHRVPLIIDWPGLTTAGTQSDGLVCLSDLYATIAAQLHHTTAVGQCEDSMDFSRLLQKSGASAVRDSIVHHSLDGTFAIRRGKWKLVVDNLGSGGFSKPSKVAPKEGGPRGQLYDLESDPKETTNLWAMEPELVKALSQELEAVR
ncbi:MAG: arylsulfatase [Planctomycetes bacterium]|nr:arylsulfatase [Planctomycetota bacterium]MCP4862115.1 arylsulfatase [Planctomycetota bacterium]